MEKCIPVEEIEDGMVLTRPVESDSGMVLCGSGTKLGTKHISRFQNRGVVSVFIKADVEVSPAEMEEKLNQAANRFSKISGEESFNGRLKNIVLKYLQAKKDEIPDE